MKWKILVDDIKNNWDFYKRNDEYFDTLLGDLLDRVDIADDDEIDINKIQDVLYEIIIYYNIIYYSEAIKFLAEHDPSLVESLSLAGDFGYDCSDGNINSELLATLLYQSFFKDKVEDIIDLIEDIVKEFENDIIINSNRLRKVLLLSLHENVISPTDLTESDIKKIVEYIKEENIDDDLTESDIYDIVENTFSEYSFNDCFKKYYDVLNLVYHAEEIMNN